MYPKVFQGQTFVVMYLNESFQLHKLFSVRLNTTQMWMWLRIETDAKPFTSGNEIQTS
jgi:hypothetical protein